MNELEQFAKDQRAAFPYFTRKDAPIYLDSAATTQRLGVVIERLSRFDRFENANVHRSGHQLGRKATHLFEEVRKQVKDYIGASRPEEIIWTRGTTEALNLIASAFGPGILQEGDEILVGVNSHHSNLVPWKLLADRMKAIVKPIPLDSEGKLDLNALSKLITSRTKIVAVSHVTHTSGTLNPIPSIVEIAHEHHAYVVVDGAQALAHMRVDVKDLDCDFYAFSGHKLFGPTGIGCLYGKYDLLDQMIPWQGGGEMVSHVSFEKISYQPLPLRLEAGTPPISQVVGLGEALTFLSSIKWDLWKEWEKELIQYARYLLEPICGFRWVVDPGVIPILNFNISPFHPMDLAMILDEEGIAVRTGTHCSMPFYEARDLKGGIRVSLSAYNLKEDLDALFQGLKKAISILG